jgi:large subunit ribosomal protein L34
MILQSRGIDFILNSIRIISKMSKTYQPKKRKRARTHGFLSRLKTIGGKRVIAKRRAKGRKKLAV